MRYLVALIFSVIAVSSADIPVGSDEAAIKIGDTRLKVETLLGEIEAMEPVDRSRTKLTFKRCSIVFESGKVSQLPVMRSEEELARKKAEKIRADKDKAEAALPSSPQNVRRRQALVASLVPRFDIVFSRAGFPVVYRHKSFQDGKYGLMPSVLVDDRGSLALATTYHGGAWLFHDSLCVRIADKTLPSSVLPQGKPQRQVLRAGFIEECCVFDSEEDQNLVREISKSKGVRVFIGLLNRGGALTVRLTEQQFASFPPIVELSASEMAAVRDSVDLADAFSDIQASK